jgi:preprotein translocase subunit SecE
MVVIMTTILGIFFFAVDSAFSALVQALLGLLN